MAPASKKKKKKSFFSSTASTAQFTELSGIAEVV